MDMKHLKSIFRGTMKESSPYRVRFGHFLGFRLWLTTRNSYKLSKNSVYNLKVPGLKYELWLRSGTSDIGTFKQVVCERETEFPLEEEPKLIIDAGANIGLFSIMMATRYPDCKIVALEVEGGNFELLRKNVASYKNIIPMQRALWKSTGHVRIADPTAAENAFTVVEAGPDEPGAIAAVSIDGLLRELGCSELSLLKMDIEGSELEVLEDRTADWISITKAMLVELHDRFRPGCTNAFEKLVTGHQVSHYGEYRFVKFYQSLKPINK